MDDFNSVIYSKTVVVIRRILAEFARVLARLENNSHVPLWNSELRGTRIDLEVCMKQFCKFFYGGFCVSSLTWAVGF